jgi:inorganic pyrophosphatase
MSAVGFLNQIVHVEVDRPLGSHHPQHGFIYSVNYGYVPDTLAPDGEPLDAYVLGIFDPIETFTGCCIAIIHRLDDDDDKLIVVPDGRQFSDEQIQGLVEFQERFFTSIIQR